MEVLTVHYTHNAHRWLVSRACCQMDGYGAEQEQLAIRSSVAFTPPSHSQTLTSPHPHLHPTPPSHSQTQTLTPPSPSLHPHPTLTHTLSLFTLPFTSTLLQSLLNYDIESDDEWEEEEQGESISSSEVSVLLPSTHFCILVLVVFYVRSPIHASPLC